MSGLAFTNASAFFAAVDEAIEDTRKQAEDALTDLGENIAEREIARAPELSGRGKDTIKSEPTGGKGNFTVEVGPGEEAFYLGFYEFGTGHQPPRPFMRPAIAEAVAAWKP